MAERWRTGLVVCGVVALGLGSCSSPTRNFGAATGGGGSAGNATAGGSHNQSGAAGQTRGDAGMQEEAGAAGQGDAGATQEEQAGAAGQGSDGAPPDACCGASCAACSLAAPRCKELGTTSRCVQCMVDTDCGLGVCDWLTSNGCRPPLNGCNTLKQIGPTITAVSVGGTMPAGTHGTFVAGTYVLTGTQRFGTAEAPTEGQTLTVAVNGTQATLNSYENLGDSQYRWTADFHTSSVPATFTFSCFAPNDGSIQTGTSVPDGFIDYSVVNATTLWLLYPTEPGSGVRYIFTKQ